MNKDHVIEQLKKQIEGFKTETDVQKVGKVVEVGDGVARISGLSDIMASEMVEFPNGEIGVFSRQKDLVRDLKHIVDTWRSQAIEFKGNRLKVTFWDRFLINTFKFFYPIF